MKNIFKNRFKFKIWDKTEKKFLPLDSKTENTDSWISIDNTGVYLVERDNARDVAFFTDITEDVIILQCTGLRDKNGKLIYEGDIVSVKVKIQDVFYADEYYFENYKGKIIFEKGEIAIDVIDTTKHPISLYYHTKDCEVIGNIYENPKLLENN